MSPEPLRLAGPGDTLPEEGAALIRERTGLQPGVGIILGSGLGDAVREIEEEAAFSYEGLPGFPAPTAPGHAGRLVLGRLHGVAVAAFLGRVHFYEGHPMALVTLPVRLAYALGARAMVITASAGGLDGSLGPRTLVVGTDHINFMGVNPLRGWRRVDGTPPFIDLTETYDRRLAELAFREADGLGIRVARGVYLAVSGPTYETPAEIGVMRDMGGSVVGMSVVPEALAARALDMRVLGLFSVTNAVGIEVTHQDVVRVAGEMTEALARVLGRILPHMDGDHEP